MRSSLSARFVLFIDFNKTFARYALHIRETLVGTILLIVGGGFAISWLEGLPLGDAIYFAFITGLTIGYGDISPVTMWGRILSVAIGVIGLIFTGLTVAVATRALADTAKRHVESQR